MGDICSNTESQFEKEENKIRQTNTEKDIRAETGELQKQLSKFTQNSQQNSKIQDQEEEFYRTEDLASTVDFEQVIQNIEPPDPEKFKQIIENSKYPPGYELSQVTKSELFPRTISTQLFINEQVTEFYQDYELLNDIDSGGFAQVFQGKELKTEQIRAIKAFEKASENNQNDVGKMIQEVQLLKEIDHPNIMRTYGYYQNFTHFYLISEYLEGQNLFNKVVDRCKTKNRFQEYEGAQIMFQLLLILKYLHSNGIVHHDIKANNVVFHSEYTFEITLVDFGESQKIQPGEQINTPVGAYHYMAPEILQGQDYDHKIDIWAAGVLMYFMFVGNYPFASKDTEETETEVTERILQCDSEKYPFLKKKRFRKLSDEAKNLMLKMMRFDPEKRIKIKEALKHD